jgi:hypothetical protein
VHGLGRRGALIGPVAGAGAGIVMAVSCLLPAGARAAVPAGTWGKAQLVSGLAALGSSGILSVSCASPGNCGAGGYLSDSSRLQAFVVSQRNGRWGKAEEVPGIAALNTGGEAQISSMSCASPGNCSAAGEYSTPAPRSYPVHAFVVSQKNGIWGKARKVPGLAALSKGSQTQITSLSCASPGNCSAAGSVSSGLHAFVVSQKNGTWGEAKKVPGLVALTEGGFAKITSVSCGAAGNCSAGGSYTLPPGTGSRAFVVSQRNGRWGKALPIRGMDVIFSVSCASAGNCSAGGGLFAVSEKKGTWGKAEKVPGLAALSKGGHASISSVSCASPGNCSAGGSYTSGSAALQGFVVSQENGTWRRAIEVPGLGALNTGEEASVAAVSCASPGNCGAGGIYADPHDFRGFVVSQANGVWGKAEEVPGLAALNKAGFAEINSVSCAPAGNCSAGGITYVDNSRLQQAFVVSQAK